MGAFKGAVRIMFKRPPVFIFFGLVALVLCVFDYFLSSLFISVNVIGSSDILKSAVSLFHLVYNLVTDISFIIKAALISFLAVLAASFVVGFGFSGCMNIINNSLQKKPKFNGEFVLGVKKYFSRIFRMVFTILILVIFYTAFMVVALIPALVVSRAAFSGKPELFLLAILLDLVTAGVVFFSLMFFRIYVLFWFPAAINNSRRAFVSGKRVADACFWHIVKSFITFDIVYVLFQITFISANYIMAQRDTGNLLVTMAVFTVNWFFKSVFYSLFAGYVFSAYKIFGEGKKA